jgi:hypothetical protein
MQIDRSNYEIWFIDWLDGNLNSLQTEQLKLFLNENPDLREEFNDLTPVTLSSTGVLFRNKDLLKKSPPDLSPLQFEYLCAACLENDLSDNQKSELKEIADAYPDKKRTFDLMQKTRIIPPKVSYKHKYILRKRTAVQKIIRLSVIGLSTAAAIGVIVIIYSVLPGIASLTINRSAQSLVSDTISQKPSEAILTDNIPTGILPEITKETKGNVAANNFRKEPDIVNSGLPEALSTEPSFRKPDYQEITINRVPVYAELVLKKADLNNTLIASNMSVTDPEDEDERSGVVKFISKTFREKVLHEKTALDAPIKGLDIAEAGVSGLNKLFGWEMALDKNNDENGKLKSVYFSSRILKFTAPVKKSEPLP